MYIFFFNVVLPDSFCLVVWKWAVGLCRKTVHEKITDARNMLIFVKLTNENLGRKSANILKKMFVFRIFLLTLHSQN